MSVLTLTNVSRRWIGRNSEVQAAKDVDLEVNTGEFHVIRGPSGAGKSTLILLASGLLKPDSGEVRVHGKDPAHTGGAVRTDAVGVVFQSMHLLPYLDARANVHVSLPNGGESSRTEELLARLGIADRAGHLPSELSAGERQRVALARAMVTNPTLLLADEPTGNLDPKSSALVFEVLDEWRTTSGQAVVMATHEPEIPVAKVKNHVMDSGILRRGLLSGAMLAVLGSVLAMILLVLILWILAATPTVSGSEPLRLYCAAGLKPAVEPAVSAFTRETGIPLEIQYGGSGTLLAQFEIDPSAVDLYLAADEEYLDIARRKGLVREILPLAQMRPVIAVLAGNPLGINTIDDLSRNDLRVAIANPDAAAIGRTTRSVLEQSGDWETLRSNVRVFKPTVNDLANDLKIGAVDAAVTWDATVQQYPELDMVRVDIFQSAAKTISIGVAEKTSNSRAALAFARFLASSDHGMTHFHEWGYQPLPGEPYSSNPQLLLFAGTMFNQAIEDFDSRIRVARRRPHRSCLQRLWHPGRTNGSRSNS